MQRQIKGYSVCKKVSKDVKEQRDFLRVEKLKFYIRKASDVERDRMDQAQQKIRRSIYAKVHRKNYSYKLRQELKKLPIVVRANFVKMYALKNQTKELNREARRYFRH